MMTGVRAATGRRTLGRSRKVRRHADFQRIQASGGHAGRATTAHFVFLLARAPEGSPSRLGLVVTKKIGGAVQRNRIKRVCRECFRLTPGFLPAGVDLIVIARRGAEALGLAQVREEWGKAHGALRHHARQALAQPVAQPHDLPRASPSRPPAP